MSHPADARQVQGPGEGGFRRFSTRPRFLALAAFLYAGDLKADPRLGWIPVDLTLLTGAVLGGVLVLRLLHGARLVSLRGLGLVGLWFLSFVPGVFQAAASDYTFQKVATLFTFTLLAALAPFLLVAAEDDVVKLMNALAYFCLAITLGALLGGGFGDPATQRLQAFGAGTISLGRAAGLLFLYAASLLALEAVFIPLTLGALALAGIAALSAGSRGPIVAALAVLGVLFTLGRRPLAMAPLRLGLAAGLVGTLLAASLSLAPQGSLRRMESFFHGQEGASEAYRAQALGASWRLLKQSPLGLGWGGFVTQVDPEKGVGRQYPHNLLAEVTLESGWLCGLATTLVLAAAAAVAWSRSGGPGGSLAFAGLLFCGVNAMVSGDVNDNRPLFMFVTVALVLGDRPLARVRP